MRFVMGQCALAIAVIIVSVFTPWCAFARQGPEPEVTSCLANIIPTPQEIRELGGWISLGDNTQVALEDVAAPQPQERVAAEAIVEAIERAGGKANVVEGKNLKPSANPHVRFEITGGLDRGVRLTPDQMAQAYRITVTPDSKGFIIRAPSPLGVLYGAMTLCAMIAPHAGTAAAPRVSIFDYPDIPYRWVRDPSFVGYDPKPMIDWCLAHKINLVRSRRWRYSTNRYEERLQQNRYARERGIRMLYWDMGNVGMKNRRGYPDGETYLCIGHRVPSESGYCVSNEALITEKCRKIAEFVEATEPGALYIHFIDVDKLPGAIRVWLNRCEQCRKLYPNDNLGAADGKAGAQAKVFDAYCEAIFGVKHPESGYDAARDCLIIFVSCPYTQWSEDDEAWDREMEYYCTMSRLMRHVKNVHFTIRENGRRRDNGRKRCLELAQALKERGNGHQVMMYYLSGDSRHTKIPWPRPLRVRRRLMAGPALTKSFEGVGSILEAGTSDPLLQVEYAWNMDSPGFIDPATHEEWRDVWLDMLGDRYRPGAIFSHDGFLGRMCRHLYGPTAGPTMEDYYRPQAYEKAHGDELLPEAGYGWLSRNDTVWRSTINAGQFPELATYCESQAECNQQFLEGLEVALTADDIPPLGRRYMQGCRGGVKQGVEIARAQAAAFQMAVVLIEEGRTSEADALGEKVQAHLAAAQLPSGEKAIRSFCSYVEENAADVRGWSQRLENLSTQGPNLREALATSLRGEAGLQAISRQNLKGARIAFWYEALRFGELPDLLQAAGAICKDVGRCTVSEAIADTDLLCYPSNGPGLSFQESKLLLDFVEAGGAICVFSGAPFHLCQGQSDLSLIAPWLGARRYTNSSEKEVTPAGDTVITAGLALGTATAPPVVYAPSLAVPVSTPCLTDPLHGLAILTVQSDPNVIRVMICEQGNGRSAYVWDPETETTASDYKELLIRVFAWLCGVSSRR